MFRIEYYFNLFIRNQTLYHRKVIWSYPVVVNHDVWEFTSTFPLDRNNKILNTLNLSLWAISTISNHSRPDRIEPSCDIGYPVRRTKIIHVHQFRIATLTRIDYSLQMHWLSNPEKCSNYAVALYLQKLCQFRILHAQMAYTV